jgi:hypothetical protein
MPPVTIQKQHHYFKNSTNFLFLYHIHNEETEKENATRFKTVEVEDITFPYSRVFLKVT